VFAIRWLGLLAQSPPEIDLEDVVGDGLTTRDYLMAAGVLIGSIIVAEVAGWLLHRQMTRNDDDARLAHTARRALRILIILAGTIVSLQLLDARLTPLLGALGIVILALAFAAQPILENAFASTVLRRRKHFGRGDQIAIDDTEGTVLDVNLRNVVLRSYDGERVTVPCGVVVKSVVTNRTILGPRRTTLRVGVHYRTDLRHARDVLLDAVASVPDVRQDPPPEVWVLGFFESSIDLEVRYWSAADIATIYRVRNDVAIATRQALDEASVEIPFPQRVVRMVPNEVPAGG
jgi:small-conductance mechanosensitive channel